MDEPSSGPRVPVLDMSPWWAGQGAATGQGWAEDLCRHAHEVGFFILTGHGVDTSLRRQMFQAAQVLFTLPESVKSAIAKQESPCFRGWEPVGSELTNGQPDLREQVDIWTEHPTRTVPGGHPFHRLHGPNPWLPESVLPGHRRLVAQWLSQMDRLSTAILEALAVGLGLPLPTLTSRFGEERMSLLKLIRYIPTPEGAAGVNPHHDTGFLTLLAADGPGLEIEGADGEWLSVPVVDDGIVVNLGELLQAMTSNYLVATPHRVVARGERLAIGYFHGPSLDMPLEPLRLDVRFAAAVAASPRHAAAGFMAPKVEVDSGAVPMRSRDLPECYGEQLWRYFERSYPELVARHHPDLAPPRAGPSRLDGGVEG